MDIFTCINRKRSVRVYEQRPISVEDMDNLLEAATKASTGSGLEPWGFVVLNEKIEIDGWSEKIKQHLLEHIEEFPYLAQYESWLKNPKFHVFNHANTVLAIYGNCQSHWKTYDCSLAAGNIMLSAFAMGIGTCWIGFAEYMLNTDTFKTQYRVPAKYDLVCSMSMGYMKEDVLARLEPPKRKAPVVFYR